MKHLCLLLVLISTLQGCIGQIIMDPEITIPFTVPPSDGERVRGTIAEDVTLTCHVENWPPNLSVRWQRTTFTDSFEEKQTIPISSDMSSEDINKWSIEKPTAVSWRLRIKALRMEDQGNYTCYIELTRETRILANRTVLVTAPPLIIEGLTSSDTSGEEGDTLSMTCNATGIPTPTIYWRREGDALLPGGGVIRINPVLQITQLLSVHQGRYFCEAINEVGEDHRDIILSVQYPPKLQPDSIGGTYLQAVGYKRTLGCLVDANPKPNYEFDSTQLMWMKGTSAIGLGDRIYTRMVQGAYNRMTFELVFAYVEADDYGTYTCRASNTMGSSDLDLELIETDEPQLDKGTDASSASFASLHLLLCLSSLFISILSLPSFDSS